MPLTDNCSVLRIGLGLGCLLCQSQGEEESLRIEQHYQTVCGVRLLCKRDTFAMVLEKLPEVLKQSLKKDS